jgi:mannose-1-phosphate guanylyltransferase
VLEPSVLDRIASDRRVSIEREVFPAMASEARLYAMSTNDYWLDTGTPQQYLQANIDLLSGRRGGAFEGIDPTATVDPAATVERSVISSGCRIDAGVIVHDSVLMESVTVETGATVNTSVIGSQARIGAGATLDGAVVGDGYVVAPGQSLSQTRVPEPA